MNERRWERLGAQAGIAFVVLGVIGIILQGEVPGQNASGAELTEYLVDQRDGLMWSSVVWSLAAGLGLFFIATLRARLSEAEGGHNELATAAVVGGIFTFVANFAGSLMVTAMAFRDGGGLSAEVVRMGFDVSNLGFIAANVGVAIVGGSVAAVVLSTGLLPRWVGWLSLGTMGLCVVSLIGVGVSDGFMAPGGGFHLIAGAAGLAMFLAVAIELMLHAEAPAPAGTPARAMTS